MIFGITFNMAMTSIYYVWFDEHDFGTEEVLLKNVHVILWITGLALFAICLPLFIASVVL